MSDRPVHIIVNTNAAQGKAARKARALIAAVRESLMREVFLAAIGNGVSSGGGFILTPRAQLDDGQLDVCLVSGVTRWRVLRVLPEVLSGKHLRQPEVEYFQTTSMQLTHPEGLPLHADGEYLDAAAKSIHVKIFPASLKILYDNRIIVTK